MGYIKKLKSNELVGGTDKTTIYPVTSTEAVFEEITNGNESSFKSQKTINKEQQDELDDHEERIQAAEAEDIKSITINGSTKEFRVDGRNNVDLTIYTVDNDPEMPSIASNVEDLRNMVGTSTPVLETSHKTRIETLEGGESVTGSVENKIKTKVDSINSSYQDDNNEYVKYSMTQTSGEVTDFNIDETNLKNAITSLNTSISGDNIVIRSGSTPSGTGEAGKIYRYVNSSNNTYTDYMYSGGSWVALATHDTSNEQAQVAYYTCTATGSGAQATKQFVGNGSLTYTPSSGGHIKILMGEANTATGTIYLQFGTTTSTKKPLYYNGESVSSDNTWEAGETIAVYYDPSANNTGAYFASNAQGGGGKAKRIKYDNSQSGLSSENVQGALDEVSRNIDDIFQDNIESDFDISDEQGYAIARFKDGEVQTKNFDSSAAPSLDDATQDFAISDENNWDVVQFVNGHVKTKNFDSSLFINTTKKFIGKKFAILGDSISTFQGWLPSDIAGYDGATYATYYKPSGSGNVNSVNKTWWYQMLELLGITPSFDVVNNCSWSGSKVTGDASSTTSASAGCSDRRISDLSIRGYVPDIIIVFISCNDWGDNVSVGTWDVNTALPNDASTFRSAYAMMLNKINIAYPKARIFCCTNLDDVARDRVAGYPPNNTGGVTTYSWNQNIIEIAEAFGCDVINMHDCGIKYSNITSLVVDSGLHPNMEGMTMMAQKAASELIAKY